MAPLRGPAPVQVRNPYTPRRYKFMVSLAHISDVHLSPLPAVGVRDLLNKRITGFLNWRMNRTHHMHRNTLAGLVTHMKAQQPDFTAVTGDLTNLGLDAEFTNAAAWLKSVGAPSRVCAIPGNHDAYVRGARERFRSVLGEYATGELIDTAPYPFVRRIGDVAIVGCSSAVATPPFFASGNFSPRQAVRLEKCLDILGKAGFFRVVLIHHPPNDELASDFRLGLSNAALFRTVIAGSGAELVLHGHTHRSSVNEIDGPGYGVPVIGVAAASADAASGDDPARYNLFTIDRTRKGWRCDLREYGYQRIGDEIVLRLEMRVY